MNELCRLPAVGPVLKTAEVAAPDGHSRGLLWMLRASHRHLASRWRFAE